MSRTMLLVTGLLVAIVSNANCQTAGGTESFQWILGIWERINESPGKKTFEKWERKSENELIGIGVTIKDSDTVFIEKLKILSSQGKYYYVAEVSHNSSEIRFEMTEVGSNSFTSVNPLHDFPKIITYQFYSDTLKATIGDSSRSVLFNFVRSKNTR